MEYADKLVMCGGCFGCPMLDVYTFKCKKCNKYATSINKCEYQNEADSMKNDYSFLYGYSSNDDFDTY